MNRNMTFCEECRKDVKYIVETASIKAKLKGKKYVYSGKRAICRNVAMKSMWRI